MSVELPKELQREILSRLPLKSLMRFKCVSKKWASTIRKKDFKHLHFLRSNTRPRVLFVFFGKECNATTQDFLFHSVYQEEEPLLLSGQQQMHISNEPSLKISAPIRGLICLQSETKVVICNPGTRNFVTLPEFGEHVSINESSFGYDETTKVFKVLCTTLPLAGRSHGGRQPVHQVFTVGSGEKSWRQIECNLLHHQVTNSLCKGGVVYYGARSCVDGKSIVMSFNVRSEELTVIGGPKGVQNLLSTKLVSYNEHIALVNFDMALELFTNGEVQVWVWVWNETTRDWCGELVRIPRWRETIGDMEFSFEGTIGTGELVFTQEWLLDDGSFFVVYYNRVTHNLRKFKIEAGVGGSYDCAQIFFNHVDSLSLV